MEFSRSKRLLWLSLLSVLQRTACGWKPPVAPSLDMRTLGVSQRYYDENYNKLTPGSPIDRIPDVVLPEIQCPPLMDAMKESGQCVAREIRRWTPNCPPGSHVRQETCVERQTTPADVICPTGFSVTRDQRCERMERVPAIRSCDEGFKLDPQRNVCYEAFSGGMTGSGGPWRCPEGFSLEQSQRGDGICRRSVRAHPELICPPGAQLKRDKCEQVETVEPLLSCSKGFTLDRAAGHSKAVCIREEVTSASHVCDKGLRLDDNAPGKPCVRRIEGDTKAEPRCPPGSVLKGKRCLAQELFPATLRCPKDMELKHGDEIADEMTPNQSADPLCVRELQEAVQHTCEKGFRLNLETDQCERLVEQEGVLVCPDGATLQANRRCTIEETAPPLRTCPETYVLIPEENRCQKSVSTPPTSTCPRGYKLDSVKQLCLQNVEVKGQFLCLTGTLNTGGKVATCEKEQTQTPEMLCKKGAYTEGVCVELLTQPPRAMCPKGAKLSGAQCLSLAAAEPELFCEEPGAVLRGDHCEIFYSVP